MAIKRIFKNGSVSIYRVVFLILLAIVLMSLDQRSRSFHRLRNQLAVVTTPIQFIVSIPIKLVHWLDSSVITQKTLLAENEQLRAHELLLESKLQKLISLQRENAQLRELLKSSTQITGHVVVAGLLAVDLNPAVHELVVDKGSLQRIYKGQPVLDAYGIMGQVVDVGLLTSKILLVTDARSAVPVEDSRNGIRAIAVGLGEINKLALIHVPETSQIKVGDLFVASGLGLRYPIGYPVGVVTIMQHLPGQRFAHIILKPAAHLDQTEQVLLAWPSKRSMYKAVQQELKSSLANQANEVSK